MRASGCRVLFPSNVTAIEVEMRTKLLGTALAMLFSCAALAWLPARGQDPPQEGRTDEAKKDDGAGPGRSERTKVRDPSL